MIKFVSRFAEARRLSVTYRTRRAARRQRECHVEIDGPLGAIQSWERGLGMHIIAFGLATPRPADVLGRVVTPFLEANRTGVRDITLMVEKSAQRVGADGYMARLSPLSLLPAVRRDANLVRPQGRAQRAVRSIVRAMDQWIGGSESNEKTLIVCDQALEELLKADINLPPSSSKGFQEVVALATDAGLVSRREAYRLRRFHTARNRAQHRGGPVSAKTVRLMLTFYVDLLNGRAASVPNTADRSWQSITARAVEPGVVRC